MSKYSNSKYTAENCDALVPKSQWVEPSALEGEEAVLTSECMLKAFDAIMDQHQQESDICFLSLCTATRPYSKSFKYKKFIAEFGQECDIVVNSNGGVIPIQFETCYPFMTYNARRKNKKYDDLYFYTLSERLSKFLDKFRYDHVVANFQPDQRNYKYATNVLRRAVSHNIIRGARFAPSAALRADYKTIEKTYHQKLNPDTHPLIFADIVDAVRHPAPGLIL